MPSFIIKYQWLGLKWCLDVYAQFRQKETYASNFCREKVAYKTKDSFWTLQWGIRNLLWRNESGNCV